MRAWHAGAGAWGAVSDVNSHSIGIELANAGPLDAYPPFPEPQMRALEGLLAAIMVRWGIAPARIIAHSDMAPSRKFDPGARFDWQRLARSGLSVWPRPDAAGDFLADACRFGYVVPENCAAPVDTLLAAFRLRFRPGAIGPLDAIDCALIHDLARRYPVDRSIVSP